MIKIDLLKLLINLIFNYIKHKLNNIKSIKFMTIFMRYFSNAKKTLYLYSKFAV